MTLPILTLLGAAMLAVVVFVGYSALRQGRDVQEQLARGVRNALATKLEEIGRTTQDYAWWNDVVRNLDLDLDMDWADSNVGRYIHETFGYDITIVVGRDDRTLYTTVDGERSMANGLQLTPGLEDLVERARAIPPDQPGAVSGYLMFNGAVAAFGASPITPALSDPIKRPAGSRPVLVYAQFLDRDLLDPIAQGLGFAELHAVAPQAGTRAMLPLSAPDGTDLGGIAWRQPQLGRAFIRDIAPALMLALGLIAGFALLILRNAQRAALVIEASEARFRDVADASADWIWETDAKGRLVFLSERFAEIMALPPQTFLGRPLDQLLDSSEGSEEMADLHRAMSARAPFRHLLCRMTNGNDQSRTLRFAGKPAFDHVGRFLGYRGTASDVTAQITAELRARYLALNDPLTELPNRELLRQRLERALAGVRRRDGMVAVLVLDLDRFKSINDTLGHGAGDRLLGLCARRLQACVRDTDTVARIGGDEFALIQVGVDGPGEAEALCQRLLSALVEPFDLDGHEMIVTASIGVALAPSDSEDPASILQHADVALFRAKEEGRNTFRFFEPEMHGRLQVRRALERDLRTALMRGDLEVHYQLQVDIRGQEPVGVEALARWHHLERGWVPPHDFIPIAEETGLILGLGERVLRVACAQVAAWPSLRLSVNLSPVQFRHGNLVGMVRNALEETGLEARRLELEITERVLLDDHLSAFATLNKLREIGVRIAMDDFGTGYSSLSYLQRFPFDTIRIDRSFIEAIERRSEAQAIVRAVVGLGRSLGIRTCAEGVETAEELAFLESEGCDEVQGYYLGRPLPAADLARVLGFPAEASWVDFRRPEPTHADPGAQ